MQTESNQLLKHALTILWGQWAVMSFGLIDAAVAGRYDTEALAALSVATSIYITVYVSLMAVLQVMLPLFSEQIGAGHVGHLRRLMIQSLWIWLILSIVGSIILSFPVALMSWTDVPTHTQFQAANYLSISAWTLPAVLLFRLFASLCQSLGQPHLVSNTQIAALILKIPLTIWLTFGGFGLDPMGLEGCAWATWIIQWLMLTFSAWLFWRHPLFSSRRLLASSKRMHWVTLKKILSLGIPNGITSAVEVSSFTLMALLVARLGLEATASHQIAASMAAFIFMIPMAFSVAASARFSYWIGAQRMKQADAVVVLAYSWVIRLAVLTAALLWFGNQQIASLFTNQTEVAHHAEKLLMIVAPFHFGDALQVLGFFLLRSLRVTWLPLIIYTTTLWGIGLAGGYELAYGVTFGEPMQTPQAFWYASSLAMLSSGLLLGILLHRIIKQSRR